MFIPVLASLHTNIADISIKAACAGAALLAGMSDHTSHTSDNTNSITPTQKLIYTAQPPKGLVLC